MKTTCIRFVHYGAHFCNQALGAFPPLLEGLVSGDCDLATSSRIHRGAHTKQGWRWELISRCYNRLVTWLFPVQFADAQCRFKATTRQAAVRLLSIIGELGRFFVSELLVVAEKCGCCIFDLAVTWTDNPDSRVSLLHRVGGLQTPAGSPAQLPSSSVSAVYEDLYTAGQPLGCGPAT